MKEKYAVPASRAGCWDQFALPASRAGCVDITISDGDEASKDSRRWGENTGETRWRGAVGLVHQIEISSTPLRTI